MSHFIFMLTKDDRTVSDALRVYSSLSNSPLRYVGFKDIGLPLHELKTLTGRIKADGKHVLLEVVSTSREAELRSVEAAVEIGVISHPSFRLAYLPRCHNCAVTMPLEIKPPRGFPSFLLTFSGCQ